MPLSLIFDKDEVEFQVYEEVDHTEKQASVAATGAVMQGLMHTLSGQELLGASCNYNAPNCTLDHLRSLQRRLVQVKEVC